MSTAAIPQTGLRRYATFSVGGMFCGIDLRRRFRLPERAEGQQPMNMVLRSEGGAVSLLVDEIGDVIEVEGCDHEPPPSTMDPFHREVVDAVYKLEGKLLLALDTARVLSIEAEPGASNP